MVQYQERSQRITIGLCVLISSYDTLGSIPSTDSCFFIALNTLYQRVSNYTFLLLETNYHQCFLYFLNLIYQFLCLLKDIQDGYNFAYKKTNCIYIIVLMYNCTIYKPLYKNLQILARKMVFALKPVFSFFSKSGVEQGCFTSRSRLFQ